MLMNVDSGILTEMVSNKASRTSSRGVHNDDAYSEVLDELETVTEQLMTTQQKLWKTEDQLRLSEAKTVEVEKALNQLKSKKEALKEEEKKKGLSRQLEKTRALLQATQAKLNKSLAIDKKEIKEQYHELEEQDDQIESLTDQIESLASAKLDAEDQIMQLEVDLEECRRENVELVEEVACLRNILQDGVGVERSMPALRDSISKEERAKIMKEANAMREKEINVLREQFKKVFKENSALKERVEKLNSGKPPLRVENTDNKELLEQVEKLGEELRKAKDEHQKALSEAESIWKKKLDDALDGDFIPEGIVEEMEEEMKSAIDSAAEKVRMLSEEKNSLQLRVDQLERELQFSDTKIHNSKSRFQEAESNLKASRDEILRLKKSNTHLTSELEYTTKVRFICWLS
jgi:chromosome segregation ATPase